MKYITPQLNILKPEQIQQIHQYSLKILSDTGIKVESEAAEKIFLKSDCIHKNEDKLFLAPEVVEWAITKAPANIRIYDRQGKLAFDLGADHTDNTYFGIGVTNLNYQEINDDKVVPFTREHMKISTRLGHSLSNFEVVSTIGVPTDTPEELSDYYSLVDMYANTSKPMVLLNSKDGTFKKTLTLLEHLHGNIEEKPFIIPYFNPVTPLVLNSGTTEKMIIAANQNLPFIFSNYSMSGATTPITPAGSLVLLNAELLVGLVFSQLVREGSPIILGSLPAAFDMMTMGTYYSPQSYLLNLACAEMMSYYRLPHSGTSGSGIGWGPDIQASGALWLNHLSSCIGKAGLVPFVGGNFDSMAFSPCTVVYSNQIIEQARVFARGFELSETEINLSEIELIGPGGNFLTSEQTLENFSEQYQGGIFPNKSLETWQSEAEPKAIDLLRNYTRELINNLQIPDDCSELTQKGEVFIKSIS